jgi:hypothetical protein
MHPTSSSEKESPAGPAHPVLQAAFDTLAPELETFAQVHSLLVERYPRGFSMWAFLFHHPKGGNASLQFTIALSPDTGRLVGSLLSHWWLDVEPGNRRLAAEFPTVRVASLRPPDVRFALERAFDQVIGTEESALSREVWVRRGYEMPELPWPT